MEMLGLLSAIAGLIAAILNRKRIVIHRVEETGQDKSQPPSRSRVTTGKRLKRFVVSFVVALLCLLIIGATAESSEDIAKLAVFPFLFFVMVGTYQLIAILLIGLRKLWQ